jgi:hypothetical protein
MRFSDWSYTDLPHVNFQVVTDGVITVRCANLAVMFLYPLRNQILSACFLFDLKPEQLRLAVADLRDARGGLDSWVVPALEFTFGVHAVRRDHPDTFKIIPELLASCRDLPVAPRWKRVRAQYFINQRVAPPVLPAEEDTPARKSRRKTSTGTQPKQTRRKGT